MSSIPNPSIETERVGILPSSVAEFRQQEDNEANAFVVSYYYYNDDECEVESLIKNIARSALQDLRKIGSLSKRQDFARLGIGAKPVRNKNAYKSLFNRLPIDIDLLQHKISGNSRMFYFLINQSFHLVAIKNSHIETDKVRHR